MSNRRTVSRVCPFCEATCGLSIETEDGTILGVRGDEKDPFSRGFICPKAYGVKELYEDPDRLRRPLRRTSSGWEEITWEEAYAEAATRLTAVREKYGNDAIGMYMGNPIVHDLAFLYMPILARALRSRSVFNASAIDTLPKEVQAGLMFGGPFPATIPVPDIDRTDYLLIVGANPAVSHGSLMTMPDAPGRLKAVVARGGKVVVIDPRRTETAKIASEHHFIRPGTDASFLLATVHTLFAEGLVRLGAADGSVSGLVTVEAVTREFTPESVAVHCGIPAAVIRRVAPRSSPPGRLPATVDSVRASRSSEHWRAGASTSSTCSPATSTAPAERCFRKPPPRSPRCPGASPSSWGDGRAASAASPRSVE
jgi:anaerobic selenocysteine-containing dehydrogenase